MGRPLLNDKKEKDLIHSLTMATNITYQLPDRQGAYKGVFCLFHIPTGTIVSIFQVGSITDAESQICLDKVRERANRLFQNLSNNHISALQSQDKEKGLLGGAVKGRTYIFAFCGKDDIPYLCEDIMKQTAFFFGDLGKTQSLQNEVLIKAEMALQPSL